jgi:hypothetical protein
MSRMGALVTDFTLIKGGALHRANGGYLIVEAIKLLSSRWPGRRSSARLRAREIRTEPLAQALSLVSTVSLEPEPIPLDVKVVLIGERQIYYLLHAYDPEFGELFKVAGRFRGGRRAHARRCRRRRAGTAKRPMPTSSPRWCARTSCAPSTAAPWRACRAGLAKPATPRSSRCTCARWPICCARPITGPDPPGARWP